MTEMHVQITVTEYPDGGEPSVVAGPWSGRVQCADKNLGSGPLSYLDAPMHANPAHCMRLRLYRVVPAQPGWIAAEAVLEKADGAVLGSPRPVVFYGRPSEAGTWIYFSEEYVPASYAVNIRVLS
jgi:hypothetical protein